jgi:hypothetical protein
VGDYVAPFFGRGQVYFAQFLEKAGARVQDINNSSVRFQGREDPRANPLVLKEDCREDSITAELNSTDTHYFAPVSTV